MRDLHFFGQEFDNTIVIWNPRLQICLIAKFGTKIKIIKFGIKNALFGFILAGIWKQYCHIWHQRGKNGKKHILLLFENIFRIDQKLLALILVCFFSIWVFFHNYSRITRLQGKGEDISLTLHYHFNPLYKHLDISRAIIAESSPLHIGSSWTQTGNLWFSSASR